LKAKAKKCKKATGVDMQPIGLLFNVLWSPGETMFLLSKNPRVLAPLILISLLSLGGAAVTLFKVDFGQVALQQMERSGRANNMTEEQKQNAVRITRMIASVAVVVGGLLGPALVTLIATSIYFGVFTLVGREGDFKTFFCITLYAYFPIVVRQIVAIVRVYAVPLAQLDIQNLGGLSAQVFLDPATVSKALYALAGVVDIASIWIMVLLCIGYKFVTRKSVSNGLRAIVVVAVYMFFSLIGAGLQMLQAG
jgi:hypothetical protein